MSDFIVGLTGGIGSGKTQVSDRFAAKGIAVIDTDLLAREVVAKGTAGLAAIVDKLGPEILQPDGELDRAKLRTRIFSDESLRQWLNALTHPLIREQMVLQCAQAQSPYAVLVVPLLVESALHSQMDRILVVDVPESVQIARTCQRDSNDEALVRSILKRQASRQQRLAIADDVIDNSGTLAQLDQQLDRLHQSYLRQAEDRHVAGI
ncbi:dephospho-CoA kinase [Ferrimonas pelagia]|uniref:Dephospho-CoA kinase n=1 Tax=Ferrimonas pelagia TaxID=1177826 RepID=A0ABP9FED2_9GAMM